MQTENVLFPLEFGRMSEELNQVLARSSRNYQMCFGIGHALTVAKLFAIFHIFFAIGFLSFCFLFAHGRLLHQNDAVWIPAGIGVMVLLMDGLFSSLLLYGTGRKYPILILPFVLYTSFIVVICIAILSYQILYGSIELGIVISVLIIFNGYCAYAAWRSYGYLKRKKLIGQVREALEKRSQSFNRDRFLGSYIILPRPPPYTEVVRNEEKYILSPRQSSSQSQEE